MISRLGEIATAVVCSAIGLLIALYVAQALCFMGRTW